MRDQSDQARLFFVYLDDLIFGGLLGELPDSANKLLVGCIVGFSSINHPDTQLHQLEKERERGKCFGRKK